MRWTSAQTAIVKKDFKEALSNKMIRIMMIIIPLILVVALPVMFTVMAVFLPGEMGEFAAVTRLLPIKFSVDEMLRASYYFVMNYFTPAYFIMVPIMGASVTAASSFVGEKERRTMETLLFSPLTLTQLFAAKIIGALSVAGLISAFSFLAFLVVAIVGSVIVYGGFVLNIGIWAAVLFLIVPALSLISVTVVVFASARAKTFQEAQQYGAILIAPVMLFFFVPQMTGLFLLNAPQMAMIGVGAMILAAILVRLSAAAFTPEKLL